MSQPATTEDVTVAMGDASIAETPAYDVEKAKGILAAIEAQGVTVRELKEGGASKEVVDAGVQKLLALKTEYEEVTGEPVPGAKKSKKKAKKAKKEKKEKPKKENKWPAASSSKKKKKKAVPRFEFVNKTPKGEKKSFAEPMLDSYHPEAVEAAWNDWWEASGYYQPDVEAAKAAADEDKFVMVIPPPNVTGSLHLGHALTCAVEDTLARWHRMRGKHVLWLPGTDHAGIATQVVVEKKLMREEGKTRHDMTRDEFLGKVWDWKHANGSRITTQLRRLGASVDWSREVFTMDEPRSHAVTEAFIRMFNKGRIYRGVRLVNWCCTLRTAISDIEVDYIDLDGRSMLSVPGYDVKCEFGTLTEFSYKVEDSEEELIVATTRLETMLGDTAVAVHPEDPRYTHLHGKHVVHPFNGRRIPIITDDVLVDMAFGTGAVKITPAHDPNDFACGQRNGLEQINVFNDDGTINENGGDFAGQKRFTARVTIAEALDKIGQLKGKKNNPMRLGLCSRSGDVIEPVLKPQWWVDCKEMAARAVAAVESDELEIKPDMHKATWFRWLGDIRDWCISRQLWWGHRIPAYFATVKGQHIGAEPTEEELESARLLCTSSEGASLLDRWVVAHSEDEARKAAAERFACNEDAVVLTQDPDVLDTWFSSGLFPFSTMGWPNEEADDLEAFFPGSLLETGHDILFFWVARMVMMSLEITDKLPFKTVYLHAMVRDKYGRKMSKSRGNVIDPLEVMEGATLEQLHDKLRNGNLDAAEVEKAIDGQKLDFPEGIPECGADALRFGLLAYTLQGRDVNLDIQRVVSYRQFCNKLWNVIKFTLMNLEGFTPTVGMEAELLASAHIAPRDKWILHKLNQATVAVNEAMEGYAFADVTTAAYNFWLHHLCDVYLELIKPTMYKPKHPEDRLCAQRTLWICLDVGLRLLHPAMPFVTEELWQRLPGRGTLGEPASIMLARFPERVPEWDCPAVEESLEVAQQAIHGARSMRSAYNVSKPIDFAIAVADEETRAAIVQHEDDFATLTKASSVTVLPAGEDAPRDNALQVVNPKVTVCASLKGLIDVDAELKKLNKQLTQTQKAIKSMEKRLSSEAYLAKAADDIKEKDNKQFAELQAKVEQISAAIISTESLRA